ncbi:MAG: hypothetical protein A2V85_10720 [Chloroflexi bacterium RBG_16_72_14]|nr:MAG: hypothetical protein A2V85_10720 [Chloroflexi bacterium RBG_16_72_14]
MLAAGRRAQTLVRGAIARSPEENVALVTLAVTAHLFATVALVGYYAVLAIVIVPALVALPAPSGRIEVLARIERRAMPVLLASLVALLATGVYLMTADPQYAGPGIVRDSWASLLLVKHVVIVIMLFVGSYLDGLIVRAAGRADGAGLSRITWASRGMAVLGAAVLVITAAAQTG